MKQVDARQFADKLPSLGTATAKETMYHGRPYRTAAFTEGQPYKIVNHTTLSLTLISNEGTEHIVLSPGWMDKFDIKLDKPTRQASPKQPEKTEPGLKDISAYDIFKHLYSGTITKAAADIDSQIEDLEDFIRENPKEADKNQAELEEKRRIVKAILNMHAEYFQPSQKDLDMFKKYGINK